MYTTLARYSIKIEYSFNQDIHSSKNKIKVSYSSSCKTSRQLINTHNMNILHQYSKVKNWCNCRNKMYCPFGRKCLLPIIVNQEKITSSQSN